MKILNLFKNLIKNFYFLLLKNKLQVGGLLKENLLNFHNFFPLFFGFEYKIFFRENFNLDICHHDMAWTKIINFLIYYIATVFVNNISIYF